MDIAYLLKDILVKRRDSTLMLKKINSDEIYNSLLCYA